MQSRELKAGSIRTSITRFRDYGNDLITANADTFDDRLNLLVHFCKTDPVFSEVHKQILSVPDVDVDAWYEDKISRVGLVVGSAPLEFPLPVDQRISLMYQLILKFSAGEISALSFCNQFLTTNSPYHDDHINVLSKALISPLVREIDYKLKELLDELPESSAEVVPTSIIQVISNTGHFVQQIASGSGNTQVAESNKTNTELLNLLTQLQKEVDKAELPPAQKREAIELVEAMMEESKSENPRNAVFKSLLNSLPPIAGISQHRYVKFHRMAFRKARKFSPWKSGQKPLQNAASKVLYFREVTMLKMAWLKGSVFGQALRTGNTGRKAGGAPNFCRFSRSQFWRANAAHKTRTQIFLNPSFFQHFPQFCGTLRTYLMVRSNGEAVLRIAAKLGA